MGLLLDKFDLYLMNNCDKYLKMRNPKCFCRCFNLGESNKEHGHNMHQKIGKNKKSGKCCRSTAYTYHAPPLKKVVGYQTREYYQTVPSGYTTIQTGVSQISSFGYCTPSYSQIPTSYNTFKKVERIPIYQDYHDERFDRKFSGCNCSRCHCKFCKQFPEAELSFNENDLNNYLVNENLADENQDNVIREN